MRAEAELEAFLDLESDPGMVAVSRRFVAQTLVEWELENLVDDARLITSELVSNAVLHARTAIRLTLRSDGLRWLRLETYDQNTRLPFRASCPEDATSGRGLALLEGVASRWGVIPLRGGKTVWAELGVPHERPQHGIDLRSARTVDDALDRIERSRRPQGSLAAGDSSELPR